MNRLSIVLFSTALLTACGGDTGSQGKQTIDVTPSSANNVVQETGAKVNTAIDQGSAALDQAVDAQSKGDQK